MRSANFLTFAAILLSVLVLGSCRKPAGTRESSDTKYITDEQFQCRTADANRLQLVNSAPQLFETFDPESLQVAKGLLGNLPEPYVRHLIASTQHTNFRIKLMDVVTSCKLRDDRGNIIEDYSPNGPYSGIGGCTSLGFYPTYSDVRKGQVTFALIHELGHGLMNYVAQQGSVSGDSDTFFAEWQQIYKEEEAKSAKNGAFYARDYARGNYNEFWADAFQSFYCSPESNDELRVNLVKTHEFLSRHLLPPAWNSPPVNGVNAAPGAYPNIMGYSTGTVFVKLLANPFGSADRFMVATPPTYRSVQICVATTLAGCGQGITATSSATSQAVNVQLYPSPQMGPYGMRLWQGSMQSALQVLQQGAFSTGGFLYGVALGSDGVTTGRMNFQVRSRY